MTYERLERFTYERMNRRSASDTDSPLRDAASDMASHSASSTRIERGLSPLRSAKGLHEVESVNDGHEPVVRVLPVAVNDGEDVAAPEQSGHGHVATDHAVRVALEPSHAQVCREVVGDVLVGRVLFVEFGLGDGVRCHGMTVPRVNTACQYTSFRQEAAA